MLVLCLAILPIPPTLPVRLAPAAVALAVTPGSRLACLRVFGIPP